MKQYYCQSCLFNEHEIVGFKAQQMKWDIEDILASIPVAGRIFAKSGNSLCEFFEQVDLGGEE